VDLVVPATPGETPPTGRIDLTVADAGVAGGQVPIPGMASGFALPKLSLGAVTAAVKLEGGKASVEKLEAKGGDAELEGEALSVALQGKLAFAPLSGRAKVRFQPAFWEKPATSSFKAIAEGMLASARTPDGAYQFQVYGSLAHPQLRPSSAGR
jgi:type II secretion system protein N